MEWFDENGPRQPYQRLEFHHRGRRKHRQMPDMAD